MLIWLSTGMLIIKNKNGGSFLEMAEMHSGFPHGKGMQKLARLRYQQVVHENDYKQDLMVSKKKKLVTAVSSRTQSPARSSRAELIAGKEPWNS